MSAITSIVVALVLVVRCWQATRRSEGGLSPGEHLLVFLLMTSLFFTGGASLGMNISAWRAVANLFIIGVFLLTARRSPGAFRRTSDLPVILYTLFVVWAALRLGATPHWLYGLRSFPKFLFPLMIMVLARRVARPGRFGVYIVPFIQASLIVSIFTSAVSVRVPYLVYNPVWNNLFYIGAPFSYHAAIVIAAILTILGAYQRHVPRVHRGICILGIVLFGLHQVLGVSRTGILTVAASVSGYWVARYHVKSLPLVGGLLLVTASAPLLIPAVRQKTFFAEEHADITAIKEGDVDLKMVNTSGRLFVWGALLAKLYEPSPWLGSGVGAVQAEMYTHSENYGNIKAAHSDYVVLLCETGLVGLALYVIFAGCTLCWCLKYAWKPPTAECRWAATLAVSSWVAVLCALGFDNAMLYSSAVHALPFAFTGILCGLVSNPPSIAVADPWAWARTYIWSHLLPGRPRPSFVLGPPHVWR